MGGDIGHLGTALWLVGHDHMGEMVQGKLSTWN